jgi:hypothetical protein
VRVAKVLGDLGERLCNARLEIVDPNCLVRQSDPSYVRTEAARRRYQHFLAARLKRRQKGAIMKNLEEPG